jgi:AcrR family transcriptional regulator
LTGSISGRTRLRLLHAAGEVFAERGFRGATVREICRRANVNVASVNYHFTSKEELYSAVLNFAFRHAQRSDPLSDPSPSPDSPPKERLYRYVLDFLRKILDEGRPAWHGMLMSREMYEPTGALETVVIKAIRPQHEKIAAVVREIVGKPLPPEDIGRCVFSIIGQCLFYRHSRPVIVRLRPGFRCDPAEIERTAAHIAAFSFAALRHMAKHRKIKGVIR